MTGRETGKLEAPTGARRRGIILGGSILVLALAGAAGTELATGTKAQQTIQPAGDASSERAGQSGGTVEEPKPTYDPPQWRRSIARGKPYSEGRLIRGVRLPREGRNYFTWNAVDDRHGNPGFRRWGTDVLVRGTLRVLREFRNHNSGAPRIGIADLSLRRGGEFGSEYGGLGHRSHQNGLDVDIHFPRLDKAEKDSKNVGKLDLELAQDLVDRFVAAGAKFVFVGPNTGLEGPSKVVVPLANHDDHLHLRIRNTTRKR